jgi:hypothetical protein
MLLRIGILGAILIASIFGVGILVPVPEAQAQEARPFMYTVRVHSEQLDDAELDKALDMARAAGADTIDCEVIWAALDQGDWGGQRRTYDWRYVDRLARGAEARGLQVRFTLTTTPDWVHPDLLKTFPSKEDRKWHPPTGETQLRYFGNFVGDVAERYKGRIHQYEIWNEPNSAYFWRPSPNPTEYAALLRKGYLSIKAVDPDAEVAFGGLALNNPGYLQEYYRAVETGYPDAEKNKYFFDVLGVHPYVYPFSASRSPDYYTQDVIGPVDDEHHFIGEVDGNFLGFRSMKSLMDREGDVGKKLFLSEFGYPTMPGGLTDRRRAFFLKRAFELARKFDYVEGMSWYAYHASVADSPEWTLLNENLKPSLTFRALGQVTGAKTSNVRLGVQVSRIDSGDYSIRPRLTNLSTSDVRRWELYADGTLVKDQTSLPIVWKPEPGQRLMLVAYTADGSVWHSAMFT